jgi:hypothetical protein
VGRGKQMADHSHGALRHPQKPHSSIVFRWR